MLNLVVLKRFGIFAILFFDIAAGDSHENFLSNFLSSDEGDNYSGQEISPYLSEKHPQIPYGSHHGGGQPNVGRGQPNEGQFGSRPNRGRGQPNLARGRPNRARDQLNGGQLGRRPRGRANRGQFGRRLPNGGGGPSLYGAPQKAEAKTPAWYNPPRSPYGHYCIGLNKHIKDGDIIFQH